MLSVNERGDGQVDSNNPNGNGSSPTHLVDRTVQVQVGKPAPVVSKSRSKRARTAISTPIPTVSLVIPVRNEARNIAWVLEQIADDVDEIILVDGNSTDATLITARSYRPDIRVVPQEGIGKGSALRTGFLAATGDIIVMMDADGSMAPQEIRHYLHFLTNGYDFVKGSRFVVGGGSLDITTFRRLGNRFLLAVFNTLYDADLTDLCYGFCAFHRRYLELLALSATGFEIEAEMVVQAMQAGLRIAEVPSLELPRRAGKSNLRAIRDGSRVLRTVVRGHRSGLTGHLVQGLSKRRGFEGPAQIAPSATSP
jgi:glycosyltransferase involved in cell wall biosynthesis